MCIRDRLRERCSLPATFYAITRVIFLMMNDICRTFKHNQIMSCTLPYIVEYSRPADFGEYRLRERTSLPATFNVVTREMCTGRQKNEIYGNSRKNNKPNNKLKI